MQRCRLVDVLSRVALKVSNTERNVEGGIALSSAAVVRCSEAGGGQGQVDSSLFVHLASPPPYLIAALRRSPSTCLGRLAEAKRREKEGDVLSEMIARRALARLVRVALELHA